MTIWVDAQLSPALALWINQSFEEIEACSVRSLGLRDASDHQIFSQAKQADAIIMSKDDDFPKLLRQFGPPPKIIWINCGNTSNKRMKEILSMHLRVALDMLIHGNDLVEIAEK